MLSQIEQLAASSSVRLNDGTRRPRDVDLVIQLEYVDFSRRDDPANQGPLPALEANPMITDVASTHGGLTHTADWLLDTGAVASIISTGHATRLGLLDAAGQPVRGPDFTLMLGGVAGQIRPAPGFVIDRLRVPTKRGRVLEYHRVRVVVGDVAIERPDGTTFVLDGIFGMNLLLASASGMTTGLPTDIANAPFSRVWIDGPRGELSLELQ